MGVTPNRMKAMTVFLPKECWEGIKVMAKNQGVATTTLARLWLVHSYKSALKENELKRMH